MLRVTAHFFNNSLPQPHSHSHSHLFSSLSSVSCPCLSGFVFRLSPAFVSFPCLWCLLLSRVNGALIQVKFAIAYPDQKAYLLILNLSLTRVLLIMNIHAEGHGRHAWKDSYVSLWSTGRNRGCNRIFDERQGTPCLSNPNHYPYPNLNPDPNPDPTPPL
jgi:hypothetical protein